MKKRLLSAALVLCLLLALLPMAWSTGPWPSPEPTCRPAPAATA